MNQLQFDEEGRTILREFLEDILRYYGNDREKENKGGLAIEALTEIFPKEIKELVDINEEYEIKSSEGQPKLPKVPLIAVMDKEITITPQEGYYIVYLFNEKMKGVYLSLNQGWTEYTKKYKEDVNKKAVENTKILKEKLKSILKLSERFSFEPIDLDATSEFGQGYEQTHIYGRYYPTKEIPDDSVLIEDLKKLMDIYKKFKEKIGRDHFKYLDKILREEEDKKIAILRGAGIKI